MYILNFRTKSYCINYEFKQIALLIQFAKRIKKLANLRVYKRNKNFTLQVLLYKNYFAMSIHEKINLKTNTMFNYSFNQFFYLYHFSDFEQPFIKDLNDGLPF